MTRLAIFASLALAVTTHAGGCSTEPADDTPVEIDELFPGNNELGAWIEDTSVGGAGVEVANTPNEAEALINGDADPFTSHDFAKFARQNYIDGTRQLELRIWQMPTAAGATEIYDFLVANNSIYMASSWENVAIGAAGRASNTGASWWVNARSGAFYVESKINDITPEGRADAEAFVSAVIANM